MVLGLFLGVLHDGMKKKEYSIVGQVYHFVHLNFLPDHFFFILRHKGIIANFTIFSKNRLNIFF